MTQTIRTIRIATQGPAGPASLYPQANWNAGSVPYARSTVLAHNGGVWLALRDTSVEPSGSVPADWASWLDFSSMTSGVATLGDDGKIPTSQLPASILGALNYQGTWNASTNSPTIPAAASGNKGWYYKVFVASTTTVSGINDWSIGDWIVSNGATWDKIDNTDQVLSVAGLTGAIGTSVLKTALAIAAGDVSGLGALATLNVGSGLSSAAGNLSANVTSVAGRTGAVTLAQADISGLTTASAPTFAGLTLSGALGFSGAGNQGLVVNSLTTTQISALTPSAGNIVYDSTLGRFKFYGGGVYHPHVRLDGDTITGALTLNAALTYGGVTLANSVTGTGSMALSASPTFTGTVFAAKIRTTDVAILDSIGNGAFRVTSTAGVLADTDFGMWYRATEPVFAFADWATGTKGFFINTGTGAVGFGATAPAALLHIAPGTTALPQMHLAAGAAPTSPSDGDLWFDGTNVKIRVGGVSKTFTLV